MQYKGMNLCDFCFAPLGQDGLCPDCGLTHDTYKMDAGLLQPGTNLLGKYIIGRVLGRGGFGATYVAYSSQREEAVAIKEYFPLGIAYRNNGDEKLSIVSDSKENVFNKGKQRLYEEAKTISKLQKNKNIVSVYEFFYANDTVYYSMEYLHGTDLKNYIAKKGGRLSEEETVDIMIAVCQALKSVHEANVCHRDIAPDNIFICEDGRVKIIDFGASKQLIEEETQQAFSIILKQGFAPAEQYLTNGHQGTWSDVYAIGATMYYTLTGRMPENSLNRKENPELYFDPSLKISQYITDFIYGCMQNDIHYRYQNAGQLLEVLSYYKSQNKVVKKDEPHLDVEEEIKAKRLNVSRKGIEKALVVVLIVLLCILIGIVISIMLGNGSNGGGTGGGGGSGRNIILTPTPTEATEVIAQIDERITIIRDWYYQLQGDSQAFRNKKTSGNATAYYDYQQRLIRIDILEPANSSKDSAQYFIRNGDLAFVLTFKGTKENRYYFENGQMLMWIDQQGITRYYDANNSVYQNRSDMIRRAYEEASSAVSNLNTSGGNYWRTGDSDNITYSTVYNDAYSFYYDVPDDFVLSEDTESELKYVSQDDSAAIVFSAEGNYMNIDAKTYQEELMQNMGGTITYSPRGDGWFVVALEKDNIEYYMKAFVDNEYIRYFVFCCLKEYKDKYIPYIEHIEDSFRVY